MAVPAPSEYIGPQLMPERDHSTPAARIAHEATTAPISTAPAPAPPGSLPAPSDGDVMQIARRSVGTRYRLERLAGSGGMGRVFDARDTVLDRRVAIKFLGSPGGAPPATPSRPASDASRSRVLTEARAMASLRHESLCRVLEVAVDAPDPYIVMEWIEGRTLAEVTAGAPLEPRLALFARVVDAVAVMHEAGLTHRDLKPSNILVDARAVPVIVDFGLALARRAGPDDPLRGGTPGYAAPEQFDPGAPGAGPRADVYALGVMLYELVCGRLPFDAPSLHELVRMQRESDPPLPETIAPTTPEALQRICLCALERSAALRYPDARAMALDLDRWRRAETVAARPSALAERFEQQINESIERAERWRRQGLITDPERERLVRIFREIERPESHWIVDSRRLTGSQVSLYVGGWLVALALGLGLYYAWGELPSWLRLPPAWLAACTVLGAGVVLHRSGQQRIALGYLVTASLAVPLAFWATLKQTGALAPVLADKAPATELWALVSESKPLPGGLANLQLCAVFAAWLVACAVLRRFSRSSAFTFLGTFAAMLTWAWAWLSAGRFSAPPDRAEFAELGAWMGLLGAATIVPSIRRGVTEESRLRSLGGSRVRERDAWALATGSVLTLCAGLWLVTWNSPRWFGLPALLENDGSRPSTSQRALAFVIVGGLLHAITWLLTRRRWNAGDRLAEMVRWLVPNHMLGSLVWLERDNATGNWWMWLTLLPLGACGFCYASVVRQWKPFLVSGLFYLAVAYVLAFQEAEHQPVLQGALPKSLLAIGVLVSGLAVMAVTWRWRTKPEVR